jgi:hypothetical protein
MESKKKEVKGSYRGERKRKKAEGERWKVRRKK